MIKIDLIKPSAAYRILLITFVGMLLFQQESIAQRNDYIVFRDSIFTEGIVKDIPSDENTSVFFKRSRRDEFTKYTIEEVGEMMVGQRKFFRKTIQTNGETQTVYLELIPQEMSTIKLWQLNQDKDEFFIETDDQFIWLDESYPILLERLLDNPDLAPLISITDLNWYDLTYLFKTAKRYEAKRTYTPIFVFTPYTGVTFTEYQFTIPNTNYNASINGNGPTLGFNAEAFLNFKRNISLNISPSFSSYSIKNFIKYNYGGFAFESDILMDYSVIQIPATARYYLDLSPNRMRIFFEAGFVFARHEYKNLDMYIAQRIGNEITTYYRDFSLESVFSGYTLGIGVEKYLNKSKGIVFGIRNTQLKSGSLEKTNSFIAFLGYKF